MSTINVWPGLAPGEQTANTGRMTDDNSNNVARLTDVTAPQLTIFQPGTPGPHPAVMVCPGGGYSILASDLEGSEVARWLNTLGFVAVVLHYRVPGKREGAYQDVQRALSLLRGRAQEFGIDPHHLGVLGFSAGGHLSARLACGFERRAYPPMDELDEVSCRPDFALIIYPAYLIEKSTGQPAPDVRPHSGMPPVFLMQTEDDTHFCVGDYARAVQAAGGSAHLVTYRKGGHGYGLRASSDHPLHSWPEEAASWLRQQLAGGSS